MGLSLPHPERELGQLHVSGQYTQLIECARANLKYVLDAYGFDHNYVGVATLQLARWLSDSCDYEAAERELNQALLVDVAGRDDFKDRNVAIQLDLAQIYITTHRFENADCAVNRALSLASGMNDVRPAVKATIALHRARILASRCEFAEAESLLKQAIELTAADVGPKHRRLGVMYDILSRIYDRQGKFEEAERTIRKALESYWARETAQYAWTLLTLANYVAAQSRISEAESYLLQAIGIVKRVRPEGHADIDRFERRLAEIR
jgi:tetratricopeptide (TPR) repeat protein